MLDQIKEGNEYRFFSGGEWIKTKSGRTLNITSPIDGSLIGKVQAVTKEEIDEMFDKASAAQKIWEKFSIDERASILNVAAELLRQGANEIADMKVLEIGKTKRSALSGVIRSADIVAYTANQIDIVNYHEALSSSDFPGAGNKKTAIITREPLGIVLAITPFNYPINLAVTKIAPALLAGNAVVIKGASQGTICTAMLTEVFNKAGLPKGVISFVSGKGSEIGDYLTSHKEVAFISFTGSTEIGKVLSTKTVMKPMLLELGGKDAAIVLDDCDMDLAANQIAEGAFSYAGQRCTAIKRVLVSKNIHDEFLTKLIVGMLITLYLPDKTGFSSTLTFATKALSPISLATSSTIEPTTLHGPHQGAQKSTKATCPSFNTFSSKF